MHGEGHEERHEEGRAMRRSWRAERRVAGPRVLGSPVLLGGVGVAARRRSGSCSRGLRPTEEGRAAAARWHSAETPQQRQAGRAEQKWPRQATKSAAADALGRATGSGK